MGSLGTANPDLGFSSKRAGKLPAVVEDPTLGSNTQTGEDGPNPPTKPERPGPRKGLSWASVAESSTERVFELSSASDAQQKQTRSAPRGASSGTGDSERPSRRTHGKPEYKHSRGSAARAEKSVAQDGSAGRSQQTERPGTERKLDEPWRDLGFKPLQRRGSGIGDPSESMLAVRGRKLGQETVHHSTSTADPSSEAGGIQTWEPSLEGEDQDDSELET